MSALEQRDPRMELVAIVRSDSVREQLAVAAVEGASVERIQRAAATAVLTKPELLTADRGSFLLALVQCANLGFAPDGRQAALIVDKTGKVQVRDMIGGWRDRLASHGWTLRAQAVREGDEFSYTDEPPVIMHRKARERGKITHAYAVAVHRDGRREQAVLDATQIAKRRAKAQSQAVWNEWEDEQSEKTAGRYLAKRLGLDPADERLTALNAADDASVLYGSPSVGFATRPAGIPSTTSPADPPAGGAVVDLDDDAPEPAAGAAPEDSPVFSVPAAGSDLDPGEPAPDDEAQVAALSAARYVLPGGTRKGESVGQIFQDGEKGRGWIRFWLGLEEKKPTNEPWPGLDAALRAFTRVYWPEVFQAASAQQELGQ